MRNKKGFTLIELLIVVVIVGILALAAIPLISANTRDARRSEGESALGAMKNRVRVAYAKVNGVPGVLVGPIDSTTGGCGVLASELIGQYFTVVDTTGATGTVIVLECGPTAGTGNANDGTAELTNDVANAATASSIVWSS